MMCAQYCNKGESANKKFADAPTIEINSTISLNMVFLNTKVSKISPDQTRQAKASDHILCHFQE